jgi:hypothetical protein
MFGFAWRWFGSDMVSELSYPGADLVNLRVVFLCVSFLWWVGGVVAC